LVDLSFVNLIGGGLLTARQFGLGQEQRGANGFDAIVVLFKVSERFGQFTFALLGLFLKEMQVAQIGARGGSGKAPALVLCDSEGLVVIALGFGIFVSAVKRIAEREQSLRSEIFQVCLARQKNLTAQGLLTLG